MVEQLHPFSDQSHWALKQPTVEGDTAVFVDLSASHFAKVVVQVIRNGSQTLQVGRKAFKGALAGRCFSLMLMSLSQQSKASFNVWPLKPGKNPRARF
jgi:hypothetical protein